jgi:hypothetical protein
MVDRAPGERIVVVTGVGRPAGIGLRPAFPTGRWGRSEDIAPIVAWLLSPESAWITGQVIDAEGGFRR